MGFKAATSSATGSRLTVQGRTIDGKHQVCVFFSRALNVGGSGMRGQRSRWSGIASAATGGYGGYGGYGMKRKTADAPAAIASE